MKTYTYENKTFYHYPDDIFNDIINTCKDLKTAKNQDKYSFEVRYPNHDFLAFSISLIDCSEKNYTVVKNWNYGLRKLVHLYESKYIDYFDNLTSVVNDIMRSYSVKDYSDE